MEILRRFSWSIKLALILTFGLSTPVFAADAEDIIGTWLGQLDAGAAKLRIVFNVSVAPDGKLVATLDSPDQGVNGIPVDVTTFDGSKLRMEVRRIGGTYEGAFSADGKAIVGTWTQGRSLPLVLKPGDRVLQHRPQEPKKPYPYIEEEVRFESLERGPSFAGTLTRPIGKGPFPAVLLITGSGLQNRDGELAGHKPFLVIADDLTRRGLAVLRVDDRGVGGTTGDMKSATSADLVEDVLAGVAFLKSRSDIDARRIGLIGHSEGGLIAPMAAVRSSDVAFIVMIAGPGIRGRELLVEQAVLIQQASGASAAMLKSSRSYQQQLIDIVMTEPRDTAAVAKMTAFWDKALQDIERSTELSDAEKAALKASDSQVRQQFPALTTPWMRYFLSHDPAPVLREVRVPVLAVNGGLDLQVPARENLRAIGEALTTGGNKDHTEVELPGLNHLLQTAKAGLPAEYAMIEETISPKALEVMGEWIVARTSIRGAKR